MQGSKLYVGNLSYSVTNEEVEKLFSQYGEVKQINILTNKGFGFVEMASSQEAEIAKNTLNGTQFKGRTLKIDEARPPRNFNERGNRENRSYSRRY